MTSNSHGVNAPPGTLIAAGAPSFVLFSAAANAFLYDDYTLSGTNNPSFGSLYVHCRDRRGRICGSDIRPTEFEVEVEVEANLEGVSLEMMAVSDRGTFAIDGLSRVGGLTTVTVPTPNGLPADAWVWLRTDTDWIDYRSYGGWGAYRSPDTRDSRDASVARDVAVLIAQGENEHVEFKQQLPSSTPDSRRNAFKTIIGFANGDGGTVLFGVEDDGTIPGVSGDQLEERFHNQLRASTSPIPACTTFLDTVRGKQVLVVDVEPCGGALHAITVEADKPEFYVRRGATTFFARPEELTRAVASHRPNREQAGAFPKWVL